MILDIKVTFWRWNAAPLFVSFLSLFYSLWHWTPYLRFCSAPPFIPIIQGHLMTVFGKVSVWRSKYIFLLFEDGYKFLGDCSIHVPIKFPMILFSEVEFFTFHPPGLAIFHSKKETYNFRIQKSDGEELEKFSLLQNVKFHLGGLKSVFNVFVRKQSLGAPAHLPHYLCSVHREVQCLQGKVLPQCWCRNLQCPFSHFSFANNSALHNLVFTSWNKYISQWLCCGSFHEKNLILLIQYCLLWLTCSTKFMWPRVYFQSVSAFSWLCCWLICFLLQGVFSLASIQDSLSSPKKTLLNCIENILTS